MNNAAATKSPRHDEIHGWIRVGAVILSRLMIAAGALAMAYVLGLGILSIGDLIP